MKMIVSLAVLFSGWSAFGLNEDVQNADVFAAVWKDNSIQYLQLASAESGSMGIWVLCTNVMLAHDPHAGWSKTRRGNYLNPNYIVRTSKMGTYCLRIK